MIPSFLFALMAHAEPVVGPADPVEMRALAVHVYLDRSASYKKLDKSAKVGVYHKNTVGRKKSSLAKLMNKLAAAGAATTA